MKRVLVVDDHSVVRDGLRAILTGMGFEDIREASSAGGAMELVRSLDFDLVIQDLNMPGTDGIELMGQIRRHDATIPVLVLSMYPEQQYAARVMRAGASGYVGKDSIPGELETAVRRVASGGKYISSSFAERLATGLSPRADRQLHEQLSDREFQVMAAILDGKSLTTIAGELHISVKTVSTHRARILEKLELESTVDLVRYAIKHGLCE